MTTQNENYINIMNDFNKHFANEYHHGKQWDEWQSFTSLYRNIDSDLLIKTLNKYSKINQFDFNKLNKFFNSLTKKQIVSLMLFCDRYFREINNIYHLREDIENYILKGW